MTKVRIGLESDFCLALKAWNEDACLNHDVRKDYFTTISGNLASHLISEQEFNRALSILKERMPTSLNYDSISKWDFNNLPEIVLLADNKGWNFQFEILEGIERIVYNNIIKGGFHSNKVVAICNPQNADVISGMFKGNYIENHLKGTAHRFVSYPDDMRFPRSYSDIKKNAQMPMF